MPSSRILEICVQSLEHAVAAERAGADRLELCADLSCGGVTPSESLMRAARHAVRIPIHVLVRPRAGDFCYSENDLEQMRGAIRASKQLGIDGVVLGILQKNGRVDVERTTAFVELARPLPVTFHRAFDVSPDPEASMEDVIQTGASRILTSAGQIHATDGLALLARLVRAATKRISIMPCGGINPGNVVQIARETSASEIHSSAGTSNLNATGSGKELSPAKAGSDSDSVLASFERQVANMARLLRDMPHVKAAR
ncbi:MAG TPA: copper homeostasis protein CutC [Candidatus Sulfotelmatobacter sp.]|nr:copper homeostasis protein CutC [Candidatus Sulfotelmatobacter sp.]